MSPCLVWTGYRNPKGYGQRRIGGRKGKTWLVHRWAWAQAHGDPGEMCVLHRCDNPGCYNVDHLFLGTREDNNHDMTAKGRHHHQGKTHCPRGHPYDMITVRGSRWCKRCRNDAVRHHREGKKTCELLESTPA